MKTNQNLGQYFTKNTELKEKVLEFIINNPNTILEPSVGQGDLVQIVYNNNIIQQYYSNKEKICLLLI